MESPDPGKRFDLNITIIAGSFVASSVFVAMFLPALVDTGAMHSNKANADVLQICALVAVAGGFVSRNVLRRMPRMAPAQQRLLGAVIPFAIWEAAVLLSTVALILGGEAISSYVLTGVAIGAMITNWPGNSN